MSRPERRLSRPPRPQVRREFPAIIEPALRDIPESPDPEIEGGFELFQGERHDLARENELMAAARGAALSDERVQRALGDRRHSVIGVSRRVDDKERRLPALVVVAYRYEDERAVEVWVDTDGSELWVSDVLELEYQPPPSDEELERAIEVARGSRGMGEHLGADFEATALLASDVELGDRHYGRRRFAVGFGPADERQPRIRALVDLSAELVLAIETTRPEREEEEAER